MKSLIAVMLAGATIVLAACGYSTQYLELSYPPAKPPKVERPQHAPTATGIRTRDVVLLVDDKRESLGRIGTVNVIGPNASLLTEDNVSTWVHDAIVAELARLGYTVRAPDEPAGTGPPDTLSVAIIKVDCQMGDINVCNSLLQATLDSGSRPSVTAEFPGKDSPFLVFYSSVKKSAEMLARALQRSIRAMLYDFGYMPLAGTESAGLQQAP